MRVVYKPAGVTNKQQAEITDLETRNTALTKDQRVVI